MDVVLPERDKKAGAKVQRPVPSKELPFGDIPGTFEPFLMTWNYLNVYGYADWPSATA
jgi:bromodomain adjacent to zinc finger domain protein 1A